LKVSELPQNQPNISEKGRQLIHRVEDKVSQLTAIESSVSELNIRVNELGQKTTEDAIEATKLSKIAVTPRIKYKES
jgi:hypothetical protein